MKDAKAYGELRVNGEFSLVGDKPSRSELAAQRASRPSASPVFERVLAIAATESLREHLESWSALIDALRDSDVPQAVAAIQSARDLGAISFDDSLGLIDVAVDPLVGNELELDREYHRLERASEECARRLGIDFGDGAADDVRPFEWRVLEHQRCRRADGVTAVVLRRFGEHRMANLLLANPEEYARLRDDHIVGGK
jgi:hypothetical protein